MICLRPETLAQLFSCEFCKISKNTFFTERLWATASASFTPEKREKVRNISTRCAMDFESFKKNVISPA